MSTAGVIPPFHAACRIASALAALDLCQLDSDPKEARAVRRDDVLGWPVLIKLGTAAQIAAVI
jgi:hypothetical protein